MVFLPYLVLLWAWPLTFWPPKLTSSPVSQDTLATKVWRNSINANHRYRANVTSGRTHTRTDARMHGRPTWKHNASDTAYCGGGIKRNARKLFFKKTSVVAQHNFSASPMLCELSEFTNVLLTSPWSSVKICRYKIFSVLKISYAIYWKSYQCLLW